MKRLIAIILICTLLTGCVAQSGVSSESEIETTVAITEELQFDELNDPELLSYIEKSVYSDLVTRINDENYFIENVQAIYVSKEYIEETSYNSRSNIYFGYTLAELDELYQDTRYVFTLGEDNQTTVKEFEAYDDSYERMLKNVAVGTGVILVCVVVSAVTNVAGASAISMIFAASAKSGTVCALSTGVMSGVTSGVVKGIETKDFEATLKNAAVNGSEGFKWGAISGAISGGTEKLTKLHGATKNGLTMNQAAKIQQESKLPLEFIKNFHSVDEYNVLKNANTTLTKVNGKYALIQEIDWNFTDELGRTNAERVKENLSPIDSMGKSYELHHVGQKQDSPLAVLTSNQHKKNYKVLHENTGSSPSKIDRKLFDKQKNEFWSALFELQQGVQ